MFYTKTHVPPGAHHLSAGPLCDWQIVNARILVHTLCSTLSNSVLRAQCRQDGATGTSRKRSWCVGSVFCCW
eukprot:m.361779 g.361779  ORF g.361779 m.361779 type:complete len:72 (-) comp19959_c0_seq9:532-747(-)